MLFELFLTLFSFCNRRSLLQNASSPRARWSSLPPTTNRTALTTQNYERYLALAQAEAQKRQHSRGRKLLPARRTLFQIDVLGQRSDIDTSLQRLRIVSIICQKLAQDTDASNRRKTLKKIVVLFYWTRVFPRSPYTSILRRGKGRSARARRED